ncbi:hypothetical protein ACQRIT_004614 [Beauveria bassiana]
MFALGCGGATFPKHLIRGAAVTNSAQTLLEALPAVQAGEALLQAILRLHPDFQNDWRIRQHSWSDETQPASAAIA